MGRKGVENYKTLAEAAKIFSLFNNLQVEERGVTEISRELGMSPSKVSRMLGTLQGEGLFEKNMETGKYRLGIGFLNSV